MRTNPYPNEPTRAQPTEVRPPGALMEDLQPRVIQPTPVNETAQDVESAETRQEEARTVRYAIGKLNDFLQWFAVVLEVTLAIRFFFMLIGASPANLFAGFLYSLTDIVLFPFQGIVGNYKTFEWQTIIAMIIYWLTFWAIRRFLRILITGPEETPS
jgi:YGGT family